MGHAEAALRGAISAALVGALIGWLLGWRDFASVAGMKTDRYGEVADDAVRLLQEPDNDEKEQPR
jgi:hypothetical protein